MITIETLINAPLEKVWHAWNTPEDIMRWCNASEDWHAPKAENDLRTGGKFLTRMEARDGSVGFDFAGTYTNVVDMGLIEYSMEDGRKVSIKFVPENGKVKIIESFDPENQNPEEMQRAGWQSILDNFTKYVEAN